MKKQVYLTFDDGPSIYTKDILDILDKNDVNATFFVVGRNPEIYKEIIKNGNKIGLHSYTHDYSYIYLNEENYFKDLNKLENLIKNNIGYSPKILRFPGGSSNEVSKLYNGDIMQKLIKSLNNKGYKYYDWNCDNGDTLENISAEDEINHVKSCIGKERIYLLMHDIKPETVKALDRIIKLFKENNYEFKTIDYSTPVYHHNISFNNLNNTKTML